MHHAQAVKCFDYREFNNAGQTYK